MTEDLLHYPTFIDHAMRGVVRDVLRQVQTSGLHGDHHFYISFSTVFPGVKMSDQLRSRYPKDITIVLQHQFWDFKVQEEEFSVTLSFGGLPERLVVPYAALTAFADPSVKFGLQFHAELQEPGPAPAAAPEEKPEAAASDGAAEIISLDAFRKK